ncbi:acyltransferase family protein [Aquibium oceanicum]|uniref:Acyltransferase n=1 Tax=Aquibium oceanicum TaxID=1670800 RepID=A0A1L3SQ39_9HYPH|nr:acyltransferase family protein [Aquibium oceanicum]APH71471.1 hypothetical protein BSQ44_08880 [Aquibium oceanicum]
MTFIVVSFPFVWERLRGVAEWASDTLVERSEVSPVQSAHRPEIVGLRAIAVLAVVLFHAGVPGLDGGFTGVDVFFVISGYLITRKIVNERSTGRFRFSNFYAGRVRRLLPSVIATLAISFAFAATMMSPDELQQFAASMLASALFIPNIFFWSQTDYFGPAAHTQPLLHFWSLGVEEQFYFVWPALIGLLLLLPKRLMLVILASLALTSLVAAEIVIRSYEPVTAFFWMPFRIVEFSIGAALVWIPQPHRLKSVLSVAGLVMILASIVFAEETYFPGIPSLLPCLGAALVILAGDAKTNRVLLDNRPAKFFGDISYVLYLVHWPIVVFWIYKFGPLDMQDRFAVIALAVLLGAAMHHAVEIPFWKGRGRSVGNLRFSGATFAVLVLLMVPVASAYSDGWEWRTPESAKRYLANMQTTGPKKRPPVKNPELRIAILGDSHAQHYEWLLDGYLRERNIDLVRVGGRCFPFPQLARIVDGKQMCPNFLKEYKKAFRGDKFDGVIVAARWELSTEEPASDGADPGNEGRTFFLKFRAEKDPVLSVAYSRKVFKSALRNLTKSLSKENLPLLIMGQIPPLGQSMKRCMMQNPSSCKPFYTRKQAYERVDYSQEIFRRTEKRETSVFFLDAFNILCGKAADRCPTTYKDIFIYRDDDHLNYDAARAIVNLFYPKIDDFIAAARARKDSMAATLSSVR